MHVPPQFFMTRGDALLSSALVLFYLSRFAKGNKSIFVI